MKINKNIWIGKNKPYNRNSLYFPDGVNSDNTSSGGSEYEYFALTDGWFEDLGVTFGLLASLVKTETSTLGMVILPAEYAKIANNGDDIDPIAIAIDMSLMMSVLGQQVTPKESILASGVTEESFAKYRITKEEFYNLE